nr:twin-arginine translocase subunit TatC [Aureibacter tunicatorum]
MSFVDHLEELRWHIIRALVSIVVFSLVAFLAKDFVFNKVIFAPGETDFWTYQFLCKIGYCIEDLPFRVINRHPTGQFTMHIMSSLVIGMIMAFPYAFWEIWRFISPGLYETERRASKGAVFFVSFLFLLGVFFGYYIVTPLSLNFLSNYQVDPSIKNEFDLTAYVSTMIMMVLSCAIMFQLPVVIFFLSKAGLVSPAFLKHFRKHAFIVILIISAIITPPDIISQVLIAMPLMLLYEVSIVLCHWVTKKKVKEELMVNSDDDEYDVKPLDQVE